MRSPFKHPAGQNQRPQSEAPQPQLGLRANWQQFTLLVIINAFVGSLVGIERTILPLLAAHDFGLASKTAILSFLISFGLVKALANLLAGRLGDRYGRKRILVAGWLVGLLVSPLIIVAPNWGWVVFANVLLGINQGLCWSTTVIMKIDLVGPRRRGLAMGLNEAAGYLAVSAAALAAGYLATAYALRPQPFLLGTLLALCGLLLSLFGARESQGHARQEARQFQTQARATPAGTAQTPEQPAPSFWQIVAHVSWRDRTLLAVSQAGLVNNLNDGLSWGLFPLYFAAAGLDAAHIGWLVAAYPAVWGAGQLLTGAISDRLGRKGMISVGMWVQAIGLALMLLTQGFWPWLLGAILLGSGTALVYPTLLAAVSDVTPPDWRASAVGVYRLWRDSGYAIGGLLAGLLADLLSIPWAIGLVALLTFLSGCLAALLMRETLPRPQPSPPPSSATSIASSRP
ncbi:MFS transporter [Thermogemmatispora aurantia]|uniref:MFS transporter n=1 Tax=Thermogemmatispora aurantia TaxID=2045279 RepID=A0A5J4K5X9_9CHLR|nr:MFS transporter [Thermogemmatispora aurantia]GER84014.1 MFS transporter [Thermogemmatispora aurantia]